MIVAEPIFLDLNLHEWGGVVLTTAIIMFFLGKKLMLDVQRWIT